MPIRAPRVRRGGWKRGPREPDAPWLGVAHEERSAEAQEGGPSEEAPHEEAPGEPGVQRREDRREDQTAVEPGGNQLGPAELRSSRATDNLLRWAWASLLSHVGRIGWLAIGRTLREASTLMKMGGPVPLLALRWPRGPLALGAKIRIVLRDPLLSHRPVVLPVGTS